MKKQDKIYEMEKLAVEEIKQDFKMQEEKHKQIEEMAKDYYGYSIDLEEDCKFVAKEMYDKGHRKLTKDSVVLSKEELQEIIVKAKVKEKEKIRELKKEVKELYKLLIQEKEGSFWDGVNEGMLKGSNETAEKILNELVGHTFEDDGWTWTVSKEDIQWIADKQGVEIKEMSNEQRKSKRD